MSGVAFNQESNAIRKKLTVIDLIIKEEANSIIVDMVIPVIEGMQDKQVEEKINRMLQKIHCIQLLYCSSPLEKYLKRFGVLLPIYPGSTWPYPAKSL